MISSYPLVAVVACDMPFANKDLLLAAKMDLEKSMAVGAIPQTQNGYEPFHAVYRKEPCLELVQTAVLGGKKKQLPGNRY